MKLVLDITNDGKWNIDVRDGNSTIGHLVLSTTGVSWKDPNARFAGNEVLWRDLRAKLLKS